jgi:hypothetical protein
MELLPRLAVGGSCGDHRPGRLPRRAALTEFWEPRDALLPQAHSTSPFAMNWHFELIVVELTAMRPAGSERLIINLPPRHLKSHLASVAFPAWCPGAPAERADPLRHPRVITATVDR